ncbi:hypothetical protein G8B20_03460 [Lactobacillus amylovorus]|uniref:hypothetical protein n=1 Tax=Lactobacillus amylovorus TaxID=1604 RepID=UPI001F58251A|nr:hypothetical protein [Lactobacillus amylovorus]UNL45803.1 hypothetical protein G8B20_03460 [Lactobacillus amylovorus]
MYRARVMGFNKNNMPNDDLQKNAKHRRELLRKAIKRNENKKRDSDKTTPVSANEIKKLRQQLSKYEKRVNSLQSQSKKSLQKCKAIKQENYRLRKENRESRLNTRQAEQESEQLKADFQKKLDALNLKNFREEKINNWLDQHKINDMENLTNYIDHLTDRYELISLLFQVQAEKNKDLFTNLMDQLKKNGKLLKEIDQHNSQIKVLNKEKEEVYKKLSIQKKKNKELKEYIDQRIHLQDATPSSLIDLLTSRCSEKNFFYYDNLDILINKYQRVLDNLVHQRQGNLYRYGYLRVVDGDWLLHDVNTDDDLPVSVNSHLLQDPHLTTGATVRCQKNNLGWEVEKLYYLPNKVNRTVSTKHKQKKNVEHVHNSREIMITNLDELKWAIQKKVLVVGNKFSSGFLDELKKYCQVQVMDAYEDGMQQIFRVCTRQTISFY